MSRLSAKKAFTLIELLVVVSIVSMLSSVVLAALGGARSKANDTKFVQELNSFRTALYLYKDQHGKLPLEGASMYNGLSMNLVVISDSNWTGGGYFSLEDVLSDIVNEKFISKIPHHTLWKSTIPLPNGPSQNSTDWVLTEYLLNQYNYPSAITAAWFCPQTESSINPVAYASPPPAQGAGIMRITISPVHKSSPNLPHPSRCQVDSGNQVTCSAQPQYYCVPLP